MASYKQSDYEALRQRCVELCQAGRKQLAIAQAFGRFGGPINARLGESDGKEISRARGNSLAVA